MTASLYWLRKLVWNTISGQSDKSDRTLILLGITQALGWMEDAELHELFLLCQSTWDAMISEN